MEYFHQVECTPPMKTKTVHLLLFSKFYEIYQVLPYWRGEERGGGGRGEERGGGEGEGGCRHDFHLIFTRNMSQRLRVHVRKIV